MNQNDKGIVWWRSKRNHKIVRYVGTSCQPTKHNKVAVIEYLDEHDQLELGYVNLTDYEPLPDCTGFDWVPLSKYVPFDRETVPRDAWFRLPSGCYAKITRLNEREVYFSGGIYTYEGLLTACTIDGKPAGRVV